MKNGSINWSPRLAAKAESLQKNLRNVDPAGFAAVVEIQSRQRLTAFAEGIVSYRAMPPSVRPQQPPTVWRGDQARLLDYGDPSAGGPPVLFIPSLINRSYILDLTQKHSLLRFLATKGFRPLLIDWHAPKPDDQRLTLDDYITGTLTQALAAARKLTGRPVTVAGYCMGGLLALALAQLQPASVKSLVLLATPWDFAAMERGKTRMLQAMLPGIERMLEITGDLPSDVLQALFASLNPQLTPRKFQAFAGLDRASEKARNFAALEDWVNDGVPLAGPVARETLRDWYVDNVTGQGRWCIGGQRIRPRKIVAPSLVVIPKRDHIVPPATVVPLGEEIPGATALHIDAGHIGMIVGTGARKKLYGPLENWLKKYA